MKLSELRRPFIVAVIVEPTVESCLRKVIEVENEGNADAYEINLAQLDITSMRDIFSSSNKPCIVTNRRADFMKAYGYDSLPRLTDEERASRLLKALDAGAKVIDYELDIFDEEYRSPQSSKRSVHQVSRRIDRPLPEEFSIKPHVVRKQRELSRMARSAGCEVLISFHTQTPVSIRRVLMAKKAMERRGADFGKIVVLTRNDKDLLEFFGAVVASKSRMRVPFVLMNVGENAILGRLASARLGSSWVYCRVNSPHSFPSQPLTDEARRFLNCCC